MTLCASRWKRCLPLFLAPMLISFFMTRTRAVQQAGRHPVPPAAAVEQNNLGVGYMTQYLYREAGEAFSKALALDPDFNLARVNLGIAHYYGQSLGDAVTTLQAALAEEPSNPYAHYTLGLVFKTQGESEAAARQFARVLEIDSGDGESLYQLGVLYARLRRNAEAEEALRKALELQPMNTSVMYNLGTLLLKMGRTEEGNAMMERFRPLQQKGTQRAELALGTQYGETGRYALAVDYLPAFAGAAGGPPLTAGAPYRDVSADSGLSAFQIASTPPAAPPAGFGPDWVDKVLKPFYLPRLGGSVVLGDLDGDGTVDALVTRYLPAKTQWQTLLLRNDGKGRFTDWGTASGVANSGNQVSAAVGDYDNDGRPDICLVGLGGNSLYRNLGNGRFENVTDKTGLAGGGLSAAAAFVDYDHDGDLDLFVCRYADVSKTPGSASGLPVFPDAFAVSPNRMFRNNGDGTFTDWTDVLGVGTNRYHSIGMVPADLDADRDVDLVVVNEDGPPQLYLNERNDRFVDQSERLLAGLSGAFRSVTAADLNQDGSTDLLLAGRGERPSRLLWNRGDGTMAADAGAPGLLSPAAGTDGFGTGVVDFDGDGDLDPYYWTRGADGAGGLWQNLGAGRFAPAGRWGSGGGTSSAAADMDGDGCQEIFFLDPAGSPHLLKYTGVSGNHWIGVRLDGLRSNKAGLGAKIEIRAGLMYQKFEIQGHTGYLAQEPPVVWCGLGPASKADTITVRWPSGILQSEINVPAGAVATIRELDRKGTSCPLLYTWDGRGFRFITDFLGGCAIGYLVAPGQYGATDTDEYVRIEGEELVPKDGTYLVQMANQLEEIIMFDQAQLLVVDHPSGTEIYPNERLLPAPPFPEHRIYTVRAPTPPKSAVDEKGKDVLPMLLKNDRIYPAGFRLLPFKGYAESHDLILDLGPVPGAGKVLLLMDCWIDYTDSSSNLAASQAGVSLVAPYLQVRNRSGNWQTVLPSMGFPAGLPRTITVDLTGKFLTQDHHVRIVTNMRIYWDRIRTDTSAQEGVRVTRLEPSAADLHFLGYPAYFTPDGRQPRIYDYGRIQASEFWLTHAGAYTRFGDVRDLLLKRDDMYVITRHGDEVSLVFEAASVPALSAGWARDYLLYADGYGKDMDLNSLYPDVVGPLPFHAMTRFPYPAGERYPDDEAHRTYLKEYNTRVYPAGSGDAPTTGGLRRR
jgi:Flp pilus assembly protein TadD